MTKDIPEISLQRLPVYLNYLKSLPEGDKYISSGAIAAALGMGEVLVRKDLAYTSSSGRPKVGYVRTELIAAIEEYLGCDKKKTAVLVGVGGLGSALLGYGGFGKYGIDIVEAYDNDPAKVGTQVGGRPVLDDCAMAEGIGALRRSARHSRCARTGGPNGVRPARKGGNKGRFKLRARPAQSTRKRGGAQYRRCRKPRNFSKSALIINFKLSAAALFFYELRAWYAVESAA